MKLAVKFSQPNQYKGGSGSTFASNLIQALHKQHTDLKLFTESPDLFSDIEGLSIHYAENPILQKSSTRKITSWLYQQAFLENELVKHNIDVLYCPYNNEALLSTQRIPQVITVHDLIPLRWQDDFKITANLWKYLYIPTMRNAKAVITVSENTKQDILKLCNISADKVFVISNGFSSFTDIGDSGSSYIDRPYILYVSSSHYPYKNLLKLFEAYHTIHLQFPHQLVVVGKSVPRFTPQIKAKIAELGLEQKILLLENLSNPELTRLYKGADLFVYPSMYEGFGIPPLEAMFHGIPVVAAKVASIPEVCGQAALYIQPDSVGSIADGIIKALTDSELRQKLQLAGREQVKKFSWEQTANKILDVCQMTLT
jgi:glycosyltransferase involved in cell wall biosynthesis